MVKRALKTYEVNEPRATIDLLIVVVDFESVANATLFITTIAKILLITKFLFISNVGEKLTVYRFKKKKFANKTNLFFLLFLLVVNFTTTPFLINNLWLKKNVTCNSK